MKQTKAYFGQDFGLHGEGCSARSWKIGRIQNLLSIRYRRRMPIWSRTAMTTLRRFSWADNVEYLVLVSTPVPAVGEEFPSAFVGVFFDFGGILSVRSLRGPNSTASIINKKSQGHKVQHCTSSSLSSHHSIIGHHWKSTTPQTTWNEVYLLISTFCLAEIYSVKE